MCGMLFCDRDRDEEQSFRGMQASYTTTLPMPPSLLRPACLTQVLLPAVAFTRPPSRCETRAGGDCGKSRRKSGRIVCGWQKWCAAVHGNARMEAPPSRVQQVWQWVAVRRRCGGIEAGERGN